MMFKPGFNASSLPPETCSNTTSELFMFNVDASQGWTAFHLVNAAAVSRLSVSLDGHSMFVYAADGLYVKPQEVKVSFCGCPSDIVIKYNRCYTFRSVSGIQ